MQTQQKSFRLAAPFTLLSTLALSASAFAQAEAPVLQPGGAAPGAAPAATGPAPWLNFVLLGGMVFFMYMFVIRPNSKRQKEHKKFVDSLVPGKEVVTSSGLIGKIVTVADTVVTIDLGGTSVRVLKSAVSGELGKASTDAATNTLATSSK